MKGRTILVTGGAGFIGSNFVRRVHRERPQDRIIVLDILTYAGSIDNLPVDLNHAQDERLEFWYGDVQNGMLVEALMARVDTVVHFAAESHVTRSIYDNHQFFLTDVLGTQAMANAAVHHAGRIERFIHISTSEVYGTADAPLMNEDHALKPLSPYASAKAGADRLVYSYWAAYGLPAVIVRPFNNYGPYQHLEKAVPRFVTACLLGEPLNVHGDGKAVRDWMYVDDTVDALLKILDAPREGLVGQVVNLGTGVGIDIRTIARKVADRMGVESARIRHIGDRPGQVFRHTADASRAHRLLGWKPAVSFEQGLDRTIEWYRNNESWWRRRLFMRSVPIITHEGRRELH